MREKPVTKLIAGDTGSPYASYDLVAKATSKLASPPIISGATITGKPIEPVDPYMVFYSARFKTFNIEHMFQHMETPEPIGFRFNEISSEENPLDTIPVLVDLYSNSEQNLQPRGLILIMDQNNDSEQLISDLRFNLPDILKKAAQNFEITIFSLNSDEVNNLKNYPFDSENITGLARIISYLEDHIDSENLFYDDSAAYKAIKEAMQDAEWDVEARTLRARETYTREEDKEITSREQLFHHLEEIANDAAREETPMDILKEDFRPDYEDMVAEIMGQFKDKLKQMGW